MSSSPEFLGSLVLMHTNSDIMHQMPGKYPGWLLIIGGHAMSICRGFLEIHHEPIRSDQTHRSCSCSPNPSVADSEFKPLHLCTGGCYYMLLNVIKLILYIYTYIVILHLYLHVHYNLIPAIIPLDWFGWFEFKWFLVCHQLDCGWQHLDVRLVLGWRLKDVF